MDTGLLETHVIVLQLAIDLIGTFATMFSQFILLFAIVSSAMGFAPMGLRSPMRSMQRSGVTKEYQLSMKLGVDEKVIIIGVAADSGCGKSTFMRRLTKVFGGKNVGPLGGGFGTPGTIFCSIQLGYISCPKNAFIFLKHSICIQNSFIYVSFLIYTFCYV